MNKRSEIKWQPFDAVVPSGKVLEELQEQRAKKEKPILSEDEKEYLEKKIREAYHTQEKIMIVYFWKSHFFTKTGIIEQIDPSTSKVYFQDGTSLYFEQILQANSSY